MGLPETEGSVTVKINRGAYPAWFLFAIMPAIGAQTLRVECDAKAQQPPQRVTAGNAEEAAHSVRGTDDLPLIVKVSRTPTTAEETAQDQADREKKARPIDSRYILLAGSL